MRGDGLRRGGTLPKRRSKTTPAVEFGRTHDGVQHHFHDEFCCGELVVDLVESDESLEETDEDDNEEGEEDERFLHHDFQHDQHCAEESDRIQVEHQSHPKHGSGKCQEIVG